MARRRSREKVPSHLRALYQLIRKYPGITNRSILEMTSLDERLEPGQRSEEAISEMLGELRLLADAKEVPKVVDRALAVHDRMARAGLGDGFRYIVRSVERGEYFGVRDIQLELGRNSNSFQRKFNNRLSSMAGQHAEIGEVYDAWMQLRYMSNPIVQMHLEEW